MAAASSPPASSTGLATVATGPDVRLFYSVTPALPLNPARPVIVLSSSLAATSSAWDAFVAEFSRSHTVVRYDARFQGQSPLPPAPSSDGDDKENRHTPDGPADDVVALLDSLGVPAADAFIGLGTGGGVGVSLAARYPGRFGAVVAVGTRSPSPSASSAHAVLREHAATIGSRHGQGQPRSVLFVVGANDAPDIRDESQQLAAAASSPLTVVPDSGHSVNEQQPARFHEIVRAWLTKE